MVDSRVTGAGTIAVLILLFIGIAVATSPDGFDGGEIISVTLETEHEVNADGYYEDGKVTYIAHRWYVIDMGEPGESIGDDHLDHIDESSEWLIETENGIEEWTTSNENPDNALDRFNDRNEEQIGHEHEFTHTFNEPGRYAYVLTTIKVDGIKDFEENEWNWEFEEIDQDEYLFEIDQDMLSTVTYTMASMNVF